MPTLGVISKPNGGWHGYAGSTETNQEAELLTAPSRLRILEVGAWIGGWNDTPTCRLVVWHGTSEATLGQSASFTVANEGAAGSGQVSLYVRALETPVEIGKGQSFYVGFTRNLNDAHQVSTGASGSGPHWHGRSGPIILSGLGTAEGPTEEPRRIGAYVADYETLPGAWIYRGGAWVEADGVQIHRSGAWVDSDGLQIYRSGGWIDSQ